MHQRSDRKAVAMLRCILETASGPSAHAKPGVAENGVEAATCHGCRKSKPACNLSVRDWTSV